MPATKTLASATARTADGTGDTEVVGYHQRAIVVLDITASQTDAADTLDVYIDVSLDGSTWMNAIHFTQQAGNGSALREAAVLEPGKVATAPVDVTSDAAAGAVRPGLFGTHVRARWEIADSGDGNSGHTFSVTMLVQ